MTKRRKTVSLAGGAADATPERLARADRSGGATVEAGGTRRLADAFDLLRDRHLLDRADPAWNALLWDAGDRYRRHWHASRLDGLKAFDFTREGVDGGHAADATSPTEAALRHRDAVRGAVGAVGPRLMPYLDGIVVESRPVAILRDLVADTGHARTAEALALERVREALHRLCAHWRMRPAEATRRIAAWREPAGRG